MSSDELMSQIFIFSFKIKIFKMCLFAFWGGIMKIINHDHDDDDHDADNDNDDDDDNDEILPSWRDLLLE